MLQKPEDYNKDYLDRAYYYRNKYFVIETVWFVRQKYGCGKYHIHYNVLSEEERPSFCV